ncbi:diacylglycerol kinase family protein [Winogradskyella sp. DF17]|uniref:Diacylglycerol kinase family protein n=1 Tax=Winogradskyella pelagia TaxID=2819984 RepID=A0ABS3T424_9FLAO|nr:diacylglycerol kinase family protein [Winogradskyella sp. DF17]MBO3116500.1 diacylglycerol kinase family protein [Winogradskyella sp. DF17]
MQTKEPFIINRLKSVGFAFKGMLILLKTEASIKIQVVIAVFVTIGGFYFNISNTEWIAQITMIGLVMSMEGMNTAIEHIADFVHPEKHEKIGLIKDVAAGAVFISALIAVIVACIIYLPKLL